MILDLGDDFRRELEVDGIQLDTAEGAAKYLAAEMFGDTATQTIADWERIYGIDIDNSKSIIDRRRLVAAKIRARGGLTRNYFYGIAEGLGYTPRVNIFIYDATLVPFRADISRADIDAVIDAGTGFDQYTWLVIGDGVEGDQVLQLFFIKYKPQGTNVVFQNS